MSDVSNSQPEESQDKRTTLTLQDLALMIQIIETGTQRGVWKPDELSSVGTLYDRITKFLSMANQQSQEKSSSI